MTSATERVGRYQLLEPIGVGPCGTVSRAKVFGVAGFERQFAVKRFHHELTATPPMASALSSAARGYGSLEHPRIARMSEFGVAQGTTFTAVEYVAGLDALRLIAEAKLAGNVLAAGGALALVSQAARAIGYAHGRGLTHLGLAPTNVIVTSEGDIKITDFGILAATLPPRPTEAVRLAHRIQYLAPEQLANEATSAATDVFALGVLAYELVTGQRTFRGDTPAQIAQSVMNGPSGEPPLPRPIVRVLQRCLARSPFERFPDARALADALDAALRVAPVPGTRKDIGAQVTATLDRIAAMNEGELSGMLALDIGTGPIPNNPPPAPVAMLGRDSQENIDMSTLEFVRPDVDVPGPAPLVGPANVSPSQLAAGSPASTVPDLPKPFTTVPGLAPPPIPVPPGVATPPPGSLPPPVGGTSTLLGIQNAKPPSIPLAKLDLKGKRSVPNIPPQPRPVDESARTGQRPGLESPRTADSPARSERPSALMRAIEEADVIPPSSIGTMLPPIDEDMETRPGESPALLHERMTNEMSPLLKESYGEAMTKPTGEMAPLVEEAWQQEALTEFPDEAHATNRPTPPPTTLPGVLPAVSASYAAASGGLPASRISEPQIEISRTSAPQLPPPSPPPATRAPSRLPWVLAGIVGVGALGVGGWFVYGEYFAKDEQPATVVTAQSDAAKAAAGDAAVASSTKPAADADTPATPVDAAPPPSDHLVITSTPAKARVFLDGADVGATPLKLPGSPDRHTVAVLLAGHELYVAQVDGQGKFEIPLEEVTPSGGPAGIKVIRCKDKERYYVFVDGKPTGMTCPTERIEVELGPHVVEVYDVVSDSRKKWEIEVKDTRLSYRVRIE